MGIITNKSDISLPLAVWLLHDEYDYVDKPNYISVTTLMKPLKQIVLARRIKPEDRVEDVEEFIARKLGGAIHDSIEKAWVFGYARSLKMLGYPPELIARVKVNPTDEEVRASNEIIPVYLEQREFREIEVSNINFTIGGKFDMVTEGIVGDNKTTSAFSWMYGTRDDEHQLQLSLYRWLDAGRPTQGKLRRIQEDFGQINYIFTDWSRAATGNQKYPQKRVEKKQLDLLSLERTESFVRNKLMLVARHMNDPESAMPECSDDDLWRSEPSYKYFSDPTKANIPGARSTKNFDDPIEARKYMAEKGGKGVIMLKPGEVKACGFCPAFNACQQKDQYLSESSSLIDATGILSAVI